MPDSEKVELGVYYDSPDSSGLLAHTYPSVHHYSTHAPVYLNLRKKEKRKQKNKKQYCTAESLQLVSNYSILHPRSDFTTENYSFLGSFGVQAEAACGRTTTLRTSCRQAGILCVGEENTLTEPCAAIPQYCTPSDRHHQEKTAGGSTGWLSYCFVSLVLFRRSLLILILSIFSSSSADANIVW